MNNYEQVLKDLGLTHIKNGTYSGDLLLLVESMVSTAYESGYSAGYEEGYEEGLKESPDIDIDEDIFEEGVS